MNTNFYFNNPSFYIIIEENNNHSEREISAFDCSIPFDHIERLAGSLFQYYEYLGFSGNSNGTLVLSDWNEYKPNSSPTFCVSTANQPLSINCAGFGKQNLKNKLLDTLNQETKGNLTDLAKSKVNFYHTIDEFLETNPISFPHSTENSANSPANIFVSSKPLFDLMGHENYLINVQASPNPNGKKHHFGSVILTNLQDATTLSLALANFYAQQNFDVGILLKPISSFQALDMVLGTAPYFYKTNYYNDNHEFLLGSDKQDFKLLSNSILDDRQFFQPNEYTKNIEQNAITYFEPAISLFGHDKSTRLVSFSDRHEALKYLKAYLSATSKSKRSEYLAKVQFIKIFGNIEGMDLHQVFVGDMVFDDVYSYFDYIAGSKRSQPFDTDKSTFDKLKLGLLSGVFGE